MWIVHSFIQHVCVCVCVFLGRLEQKCLWKSWCITVIRDSKIRHWTRRGVPSLSVYDSYYTSHITPQHPSYVWEPPVQDRPDFFPRYSPDPLWTWLTPHSWREPTRVLWIELVRLLVVAHNRSWVWLCVCMRVHVFRGNGNTLWNPDSSDNFL